MLPHLFIESELETLERQAAELLSDRDYFTWLNSFLGLNSPVIRRECEQDADRALKDLARTRRQIDRLQRERAHMLGTVTIRKDFQA